MSASSASCRFPSAAGGVCWQSLGEEPGPGEFWPLEKGQCWQVPHWSCVTLSPSPPCQEDKVRLPDRVAFPGSVTVTPRVCSHSCLAQWALTMVSLSVSQATLGPGSLC